MCRRYLQIRRTHACRSHMERAWSSDQVIEGSMGSWAQARGSWMGSVSIFASRIRHRSIHRHHRQQGRIFQQPARAEHHRLERIAADRYRQADFSAHVGIEISQQGAATGEGDTLERDVAGELRRRLLESQPHCLDQLRYGSRYRLTDVGAGDLDRPGFSRHKIARLDIEGLDLRIAAGRPDHNLDDFRGPLADLNVVAAAEQLDDRLVELVAPDTQRL